MSTRSQTTLIVVATLVIGILIGLFLAGPVLHRHLRPPFPGGRPDGFASAIEMLIDPEPDQVEAVRSILAEHSERFSDISSEFRSEISAVMDSMRNDLDPILTDEQKERLDNRHEHLRRMRDHMKPRRPPE
ncbi:MAG: hypothetical protein ABIJ00_04620 [Candidatus Eisenbacteria bacterium]